MSERVLIAYASRHGGTAEIAESIGSALRRSEVANVVSDVRNIDDLSAYGAVVLGSAIYAGRWRREAVSFLVKNEAALAERPVWLFSSGPTGDGDAQMLVKDWALPQKVAEVAERIHPREVKLFHGILDEEELGLFERWIVKKVKAPLGDYRDWGAISAWGEAIAAAI